MNSKILLQIYSYANVIQLTIPELYAAKFVVIAEKRRIKRKDAAEQRTLPDTVTHARARKTALAVKHNHISSEIFSSSLQHMHQCQPELRMHVYCLVTCLCAYVCDCEGKEKGRTGEGEVCLGVKEPWFSSNK